MISYKGIEWYYYQGALLPKVAPHYEINLTKKEQKELLKISKALFLRYTNEWDRNDGEFWYIIKDKQEGLENYKSKIRNQIKKGLKNCIVKKVTKDIVANDGYKTYLSAFNNYQTNSSSISKEIFSKSILSSDDDFWAVYSKDNIFIGYGQNFLLDNCCNYSSMKFHTKYLNQYSSYALIYTMNEFYLNKNSGLYVSDGARSIAHQTNIQDFLIKKFDFRKSYCRLNIIYRWDINLLVKILFPLKKLLEKQESKILKKISVLLKQEEIRRSFE